MATKDIIYLALIGLSAMVFYLHGYLAGRNRAQDMALPPEPDLEAADHERSMESEAVPQPGNRVHAPEPRRRRVLQPIIDDIFGRN